MVFTIDREIFRKVPGLKVGVLVMENIDNTVDIGDIIKSEYAETAGGVRAKFEGVELAEYPVIKKWREVYRGFGEKKARSSIEALIRRVVNGKDLYSINPLVDIYNLASLKFELPCGGEDIDTMSADLMLTFAAGNEKFVPLGETVTENPNVGEIIYKFADTAVCRNFNYRECDVTKLTADTKNAIIVLEDLGGDCVNAERLDGKTAADAGPGLTDALKWVAGKTERLLGAKTTANTVLDDSQNSLAW